LSGLENLSSVGGFLVINSNAALATLSGLENLSSVGGVLRIYDNAALATLSGLDNLNSIGGFLDINNNAALTNINGIQNINPNTINSTSSIFNDIEIHNNTLLSTCAVTSVCDAILAHSATTNIHSNAIGCNSQTEVEAACVVPLPCSNMAGPINGATNIPVTTSLIWTAASGATGYKLTIGVTPGGTDILNNVDLGNVTTYTPVSDFPFNTTIYVKITPYNGSGDAAGCTEESFTTANQCPNGDLTLFTQGEVDSFLI